MVHKKEDSVSVPPDHSNENIEYVLRLYITGASPNSIRAINNLKQICEEHLTGRYLLEVIDIYQTPELAGEEQIIALPLLVRKKPLPQRRLIGDMSQTDKVLKGLGLEIK
jgi:circadian clock protein KaiB